MVHKTVTARVFDGNVRDREHVIASYERHNQNVKDTIPPERLLVYDVSQGWAPLCEFLGLSVPDEPFPKVNTTDEFRQLRAPLFKRNAPSLTQRKSGWCSCR